MDAKSETCRGLTQETEALTEKQRRYLELLKTCGSIKKAALAAQVDYTSMHERLGVVAKRLGFASCKELVSKYGFKELKDTLKANPATKKERPMLRQIISIVEAQEFRCALSGVSLAPENATLDHKQPISLGGTDEIDNLQWLATEVNRAKGNMPNDEFILMCKRVAAWNR